MAENTFKLSTEEVARLVCGGEVEFNPRNLLASGHMDNAIFHHDGDRVIVTVPGTFQRFTMQVVEEPLPYEVGLDMGEPGGDGTIYTVKDEDGYRHATPEEEAALNAAAYSVNVPEDEQEQTLASLREMLRKGQIAVIVPQELKRQLLELGTPHVIGVRNPANPTGFLTALANAQANAGKPVDPIPMVGEPINPAAPELDIENAQVEAFQRKVFPGSFIGKVRITSEPAVTFDPTLEPDSEYGENRRGIPPGETDPDY